MSDIKPKLAYELFYGFDKEGIFFELFNDGNLLNTSSTSWEKLIDEEIQAVQSLESGLVINAFGDIERLLSMVDGLRDAADMLEDRIKELNVVIANKLIRGIDIGEASVTFSQYIRHDFDE